LIVATKLKKKAGEKFPAGKWELSQDFLNVANTVKSAGFVYPVLPLKYSDAFDTIFEKEKSINQLCEASPLTAYSLREVRKQFEDIYQFINQINHAK